MAETRQGRVNLHRSESGVWTIEYDRPDKLNAMTPAMAEELEQHVRAVNRTREARVVVLRGAGRAFCAGSDITALDEYPEPWDFHHRTPDYTRLIRSIRKPVISAIHGYCLGGGLEMAINGDIRIAAESAQIGAPEINWGWLGGGGNSQLIPRLTTYGAAMKFLLVGEPVSGVEAARIGIVEEVVPDDELFARVGELAAKIASKAPIAAQATKHAVRASINMGAEIGLEYENELVAATFMTRDKEEGVRAFVEKRRPIFEGR
jgi:enoyl-CoA hydratase